MQCTHTWGGAWRQEKGSQLSKLSLGPWVSMNGLLWPQQTAISKDTSQNTFQEVNSVAHSDNEAHLSDGSCNQ